MPARRSVALLAAWLFVVAPASLAGAQQPAGVSLDVEYLLWWLKDSPASAPLVSTGPLGAPGTSVLLGGTDIDTGEHHGARFTLGYRFGEGGRWGVEGRAFFLAPVIERSKVASSGAAGSQTLLIPFFDVTIPGESTTNLSLPGTFAGEATETLRTRFSGAEANGVMTVAIRPSWTVDLIAGVRYLNLREEYRFDTSSPFIPPGLVDVFHTRDVFETQNDFFGGQVGVRGEVRHGPFFAGATAKVALGNMHESAQVEGALVTNDFNGFGGPQAFPGGYFAQPSNMGHHARNVFAWVPEVTVKAGFRFTDNLAGAARPGFRFQGSDFWSQGVNVGLALRF